MRPNFLFYSLLILSGAAGIAYQTIWTKMFAVALGHEIPSLFAVITAFFGGLSAGALALHKRVKESRRPEHWYAVLELCIAGWVLIILVLQPHFSGWVGTLLSINASQTQHWVVAFLFSTLLLLPATFAMGATLPAMEQAIARRMANAPVVGGAYAMNTLGAVIGVLAATFWLLPHFGQKVSLLVFVAVNVFCALAIGLLTRDSGSAGTPGRMPGVQDVAHSGASPAGATERTDGPTKSYLLTALFFTGIFGIAYEIVCVRIISQVFEGTLYSFSTALSVYLIASSLGAIAYQCYARQMDISIWLSRLLIMLGSSCLLGLFLLHYVESIYRFLRNSLGDTPVDIFISEMAISGVVFFLPSLLMGAAFSLLAQAHRNTQQGLGQALAINTLGGAIAPTLFGIMILPMLGAKWTLGAIAVGYLMLVRGRRTIALPAVLLLSGIFLMPDLQLVTLRKNEKVLTYREGVTANTTVVERGAHRNLRVNNRYQMGGTSPEALLFQRRQAHIPLLLHPDAKQSLFLGVASGVTMGSATLYPGLQIDAVELVPEVLQLLEYFSPLNNSPHQHPRVSLYASDARRFVRTMDKQYDVIIADLFHPARDGAGLLFTQEHYQAIRERLAPGGIFCHWLPFHQLNEDMIAVITQTFLSVFPDARLVLSGNNINYPTLGLVTGIDLELLQSGYLTSKARGQKLQNALRGVLINSDLDVFGSLFLDTASLQEVAGNAPINLDAFPIVSYQAPMFTYQRKAKSYGRLLNLMEKYENKIGSEIIHNNHSSDFKKQLQDYVFARNQYIYAVQTHYEKGEESAVREYFISAKASDQFNSSYAQLLKMALKYAKEESSRQKALQIVEELYAIRPLPKVQTILNALQKNTL